MLEEKVSKKSKEEASAEVEGHFILRLPPTQAAALRAAVRSGTGNLEERLQIKIDDDMRTSQVAFDKWVLSGKVMDIPSVLETYKTLDRKIFYKTADINQVLICREGDEPLEMNVAESPKKKDKDLKDKRYLLPHGITPPLKNVRKRRFRKTLKKKYAEVPDVEKEVKRLLHADNEAVSVRCEYVSVDDDKNDGKSSVLDEFSKEDLVLAPNEQCGSSQGLEVQDIFGGDLSCSSDDSDDDDELNIVDLSDDLKPEASIDTNREIDTAADNPVDSRDEYFAKEGSSPANLEPHSDDLFESEQDTDIISRQESEAAGENLGQMLQKEKKDERAATEEKLEELRRQIAMLQTKRKTQEIEILNIENQALRQRFQANIDLLRQREFDKCTEYDNMLSTLQES